ncbi:MAG: hypothetical protein F6J89_08310 [Symploca sp. SIO1C4]|uniref:Uncharacterized protein n=1 Tax=Symploca sp. SIO1C4 TaxID=2607765 RepID=A0A6B3NC45_9CYAN|nr:hypothetical protein [Symploca sp. SIO1C4]
MAAVSKTTSHSSHQHRLREVLNSLPPKPKLPPRRSTLLETIFELRDSLNASREKGYTYADLAKLLAQEKIRIAPGTLKKYLALANSENSDHLLLSQKSNQEIKATEVQPNSFPTQTTDEPIKPLITQQSKRLSQQARPQVALRKNAEVSPTNTAFSQSSMTQIRSKTASDFVEIDEDEL